MRSARRLVWIPGLFAVAVIIFGGVSNGLWPYPDTTRLEALWVFSWIGFPLVGAFIASRRPSTRIGWVLVGIGTATGLGLGGFAYNTAVAIRGVALPASDWVMWLSSWTFVFAFGLIPFLILLFPDDRLPSRRWRIPAIVGGGILAVDALAWAIRSSYEIYESIRADNPVGIDAIVPITEAIIPIAGEALAVFGVIAVVNLIVRYVKARGERRLQMKWFVYAAAFFPILFAAGIVVEALGNVPASNIVVIFAFLFGFNGLAASIGIAVTRYRLYEIDLVINRTLVYGLLTVLLVAIYVGLVVGLQALLRPLTPETDLAIVSSTLAVAAMFNPLRRRVQAFVDRRFYRRKYDSQRTLEAFSIRLRDEVDLETLEDDLNSVIIETVQPQRVSLWLGTSKELRS